MCSGLNLANCRRLPKPKGQTVGSFRKGLAMLPDAISSRYHYYFSLFISLYS